MKRTAFVVGVVVVGCLAFHHLHVVGSGFTSDPKEIKEIEQRLSLMDKSMRNITIREANLFHKRFVETCMEHLPDEVTVHYNGGLRTDNGRKKLRIITDEVGNCLDWQVEDSVGLFGFWISTMPTRETVAKCTIEKKDIFVNVDFVKEGKSVDEKMPRLGNRSVRQVLAHLQDAK